MAHNPDLNRKKVEIDDPLVDFLRIFWVSFGIAVVFAIAIGIAALLSLGYFFL